MKKRIKHLAPTAIIAGFYREVPLLTRIFSRGIMYAQLQCKTQPGNYLYFHDRYSSRNEKGAVKHIKNKFKLKKV